MNRLFRKALLLTLVCTAVITGTVHAQSSPEHDSLRHLLTYFQENTKDEKLKVAIKEAQAMYTGNTIKDSLAEKLLVVDSFLVGLQSNSQMTVSYTELLTRLFLQSSPLQGHLYYERSLTYLANLYRDMGQYEKALPLIQQVLATYKKVLGEDHPRYANGLNGLASIYAEMGQYEKALPLFQQALSIFKKVLGEDNPRYAASLNNLGVVYVQMGQNEKALPLLQQALAVIKKMLGEEHPYYANSLNFLAVLYGEMGQYEKALPLYQQALAIFKKVLGEEHPHYADGLNNVGVLYEQMGQYEQALPLYQQALAIYKKVLGEEHPNYANGLYTLGVLYRELGEYEKALPLCQQAVAITKKVLGEEHPLYARTLYNLASVFGLIGQYEKALPMLLQVLAIYKKVLGEEHPDYAGGLNNLGNLYNDMGQYEKALTLYQQALAIKKKVQGEEHPSYANGLNNLANLYMDMGQYEQALSLYQQTLAIRKKVLGEENPAYANSSNNLANLYRYMGQYEKALPIYQQALAILKKVLGEEHPDYADGLKNLGLLYSTLGKYAEASTFFHKASEIKIHHLQQTYFTLSEQEKIAFLEQESDQFFYLPSILFTQRAKQTSEVSQCYTNELTLKGMVLENQQQVLNNIRKSHDSSILQLYNQWRFNKAFIGKQLLLPIKERLLYLDSLQEATIRQEQQLSRLASSFRSQLVQQSITAKDIASRLTKDQAAIEFIRFRLYDPKQTDSIIYAALLLLPNDTNAHFIQLFEERALQHLLSSSITVGSTAAAIQKLYPGASKGNTSVSFADSLYQLVWKPLEPYLKNIHTVYFAPTGLLHRIAFQALQADPTHLLLDKYKLNQVLSTRSVVLPSPFAGKLQTASVWGGIDYSSNESLASRQHNRGLNSIDTIASSFNLYNEDNRGLRGGGWSSLPYSKEEMENVKSVLVKSGVSVTTRSGVMASEEAFKLFDGKSPQVLHLATHGFFLPVAESKKNEFTAGAGALTVQQNPMFRSGLLLAGGNYAWEGDSTVTGKEDGILTAYEIAQMDLSNTELVVLSACQTALGDLQGSEGVIGLQRALKMAGVKQMVMSLWNVPDKTTKELMALFYQNWLTGLTTREALRRAQLKMKERYPPYYWAAFVLVE